MKGMRISDCGMRIEKSDGQRTVLKSAIRNPQSEMEKLWLV